ncbi:phage tail protein [Tumebacillus sp. ITR2]|uniref:Phage tail protein n=1 Tax=Tumebacillus amylolyticus TaxID=2801339 RepID=A0ABS1J8E3_9BACL|nr:tail fiber protein [Tumebacillus amylolyticus]MBL0386543.1 phage tail protein [Tumebacillus amylolyticus]
MSEPYMGEIRMFAGNFAPVGWALCQGQVLSIAEYDALFALLGTTYGGDGVTTFALPDLQGRVPLQSNSTYPLGAKAGSETVTLITNQLPAHSHAPLATTAQGTQNSPGNAIWAATGVTDYSDGSGSTPVNMSPQAITAVGGNQPHTNMMPTLTLSFIIALEGIFPSQN